MITPQHWKCRKSGHEWNKRGDFEKICNRCFKSMSTQVPFCGAYSERKIQVSKAVDATRHLSNLQKKGRTPARLFKEVDDSSKVANLIYHLRYVLKQNAGTIEHTGKMSPQSLNWYLINYPWYPGIVHNS